MEKTCCCLYFLPALCWEINFVSQLLCEWGLKSKTSCSLYWFWEKLTQLYFPHNYSTGCTFFLMTRDGIITIEHRGQVASMGVPWEGNYQQPPPSWASQKALWSKWTNPVNSYSISCVCEHSVEWLVLQFTHWCFIHKILCAI